MQLQLQEAHWKVPSVRILNFEGAVHFLGQKIIQIRFYKGLRTLTTNQLRENTHPTKVAAPLKRFGCTVDPR